MLTSWVLLLLLTASHALAVGTEQIPLRSQGSDKYDAVKPKRVAVIGAGIAGASAAYRLQEYHRSRLPLDITVYEANPQVGGRVKSVKVYDGAYGLQQVETGAHIFYSDDECLQATIDEVGLRQKLEPHYPRKKNVGVWDGQSFILRRETLNRRHGVTWPVLFGDMDCHLAGSATGLRDSSLNFRDYVEPPKPPLRAIRNRISPKFSREAIQATARALFAKDLNELNGLAALVAMNPADTDFVRPVLGGNYNLIYRLLKLSEAKLHLNTQVTKITRSDHGGYHLTTAKTDLLDPSSTTEAAEYDAIIIATPLQGSGLDLDMAVHLTEALKPYVERHVTHFTSPLSDKLSPLFFNVSTAEEIPDTIFTTGTNFDLGFYSIDSSLAHVGMDGCVATSENLYKVVSAAPTEDGMIAKLLGNSEDSTLENLGVRWIHRQIWSHASPKFRNGAMLDNIEVADGVFYTGVGEEVVSSLEMSCRMGQLAANLLYYSKWAPELEA